MLPDSTMSRPKDVGIKAMELYVPNQCVDQKEFEKFDGVSEGKYTVGLGQLKMAFCDDREDIYSLALTALSSLMRKFDIDPCSIGRLEVGTETILDKSKSVKSVLMQLFQHCNTNIEGIDTVNACYGGTNALFNAVNWIESSSWDGRNAIVVAGDIALYEKGAARPSGGAGCVAMLIGPDAPLAIEPGLRGSYSRNTYDFYKPDFSREYPNVDGPLSLRCYTEAVDACYDAYMACKDLPASVHNHGSNVNGVSRKTKDDVQPQPTDTPNGHERRDSGNTFDNDDHDKWFSKSEAGNQPLDIQHAPVPGQDGEAQLDSNGTTTNDASTEEGTTTGGDSQQLPIEFFDYLCFHAPTTKTVAKSYARLFYNDYLSHTDHEMFSSVPAEMGDVSYETSLSDKKIEKTFQALSESSYKERVEASVFAPSQCGNMYTASLYSCLCSLLSLVDSKDLQGKRIGMFSYGSGLASTMFSLRVAGSTEEIKSKLDLVETLSKRTISPPESYDVTCSLRELAYQRKSYNPVGDIDRLAPGTYYLVNVDERSRRTYAVKH